MRRLAVIAAFAFATPAFASWWPEWQPAEITINVGETRTVQVRARWSGIVDYGGGIHWTFRSTDESVATAFIHMQDDQLHDVPVTGIAPGIAGIRFELPNGQLDGYSYVVIHVTCGDETPVAAAQPRVTAPVGKPVTLTAVSPYADRTMFTWFAGRIGDVSTRLNANGPVALFTPHTTGVQYVWVSAVTACSSTTAQFEIDVAGERRRAAR